MPSISKAMIDLPDPTKAFCEESVRLVNMAESPMAKRAVLAGCILGYMPTAEQVKKLEQKIDNIILKILS